MVDREPGYYWVVLPERVITIENSPWLIARWNGTGWFHCGTEDEWPDDNYKVGPKIEPPGTPGASMTETLMNQEEKAFWDAVDRDEKCR